MPEEEDIESETYQAANHCAHIEDTPEPRKIPSLLFLSRVGDHDGPLSGPQKTGTNTEPCPSEDIEAGNAGVNGDQQADGVDAVSNPSKCERPSDTELVDKSTTEEAKDCKSTVQSRILSKLSMSFLIQSSPVWRTMLSAKVASVFPPPPKPPRALNIPGHMKQTNATNNNCTLGEAYQGMLKPKMRRCLYFHPGGRSGGAAMLSPWSWGVGSSDMVAWAQVVVKQRRETLKKKAVDDGTAS